MMEQYGKGLPIQTIEIDDIKIQQWVDGDIGISASKEFIENHVNIKNYHDAPFVVVGDENILKLINVLIEAYGFAHLVWSDEYDERDK